MFADYISEHGIHVLSIKYALYGPFDSTLQSDTSPTHLPLNNEFTYIPK